LACLSCAATLLAQDQPTPPPPQIQVKPSAATLKTLPNVPDDPSNGFSFGVWYWIPNGHSALQPGSQSTDPAVQHLKLPDPDHRGIGFRVTTPAGKYNRIEISGFQVKGNGSTIAGQDLNIFGNPFPQGDVLNTSYRVRNVKVGWEYLMYPAPPQSAFRIRALFQMQYVGQKATVSAPLDANASDASGSRSIFLPTLGLGFDIVPTKNFRFELRGSGMGFPQKSLILDGEGTAVVRVSHFEVVGGGKYFRYRSSPKKDQFFQGTLAGPFVGIRFNFRK
jgi:hypothetical protein